MLRYSFVWHIANARSLCLCVSQFQMTRWKDVTLHIMRGNVAPLQQKPTNFRHCALFDFGGWWWWVSWEHFTDISKTSVSMDYRNHRFIIMLVRYTHKNGTTKKNLGIFIYAEANEIAIHIFTRHRHYWRRNCMHWKSYFVELCLYLIIRCVVVLVFWNDVNWNWWLWNHPRLLSPAPFIFLI